jgi:CRISPR-associated protein Cmr5
MKEKINELIPRAIDAITASKIAVNGHVKKEFKGYISSIGSSIIQAGLMPSLAFFQNSSGKNADSYRVLDAVLRLIKSNYQENERLIDYVITSCRNTNNTNQIYRLHDLNHDKMNKIETEITDALIALKLALRTYKIDEDE